MHPAIKTMLSRYHHDSKEDTIHALKEIFQEIALLGLWRAKFYEKATFYGGTALRILHGLNRFSDDLDFSLLSPNDNFKLDEYNQAITDELTSLGLQATVTKKIKSFDSAIESAFIKANTKQQLITIEADKSLYNHIHHMDTIKIKMEIDTNPPGNFQTETKTLLTPLPFSVSVMTLPNLFAGKIHALLCRPWQKRVKGRDWYDFIWYLGRKVEVNLNHLATRLIQSNAWPANQTLTHEALLNLLYAKIQETDFNNAKEDILFFIKDKAAVALWSPAFFTEACKQLKSS